ncbi:MAG: threonylcarbamoyl-AMP synthase [Proteobacteria bacterium]|nr:threonylcarbamoyl-AMP synthase [Pseudomonadota bacterium]
MAQFFSLHPTHPEVRLIRRAAELLRDGGVIAYPTDSSYALGCRLGDIGAIRRIRALRGVDERHHLSFICNDLEQVGRYARLDNWQYRIVRQGTPGPYTFLVPATAEVPRSFRHSRRRTIGVRIPAHVMVQALVTELGEPIVSSTLIPPGETAALDDPAVIRARYEHALDAVLDSGPCPATLTTVVDLATAPPAVTRLGAGDPARLGL